jgi:hypothetical protein
MASTQSHSHSLDAERLPRNAGSATFAIVAERHFRYAARDSSSRVTCVGLSVKALMAWGAGPQALVKVERPQRSEDVGP